MWCWITPRHSPPRVHTNSLFFCFHLNARASLSVQDSEWRGRGSSQAAVWWSRTMWADETWSVSSGRNEFSNLYIYCRLEGERITDNTWLSASHYVNTLTVKNDSCLFMTQLTLSTSTYTYLVPIYPRGRLITTKLSSVLKMAKTAMSVGPKLNLNSR